MNYVKAALAERYPQLKTIRGTVIREFVLKCLEKKAPMHASNDVWSELKRMRTGFRKEFEQKGLPRNLISDALFLAEGKIKKLFDGKKVKVHNNLSTEKFEKVVIFFKKYEIDPRLVKLRDEKNIKSHTDFSSTLPGEIDMKIASQALTFQDPALITTDDHFFILAKEFEEELKLLIIHDDNAHEILRLFGW